MSADFIEAVLEGRQAAAETMESLKLPPRWGGEKREDRLLRRRLEQMRQDPSLRPWLLRAMVTRTPDRTMIGFINFHGRPDRRNAAELGYTVMPEFRRRGHATEAVKGMMDWAVREHGVTLFIVSISPDNAPSLAMAGKLGFLQVGTQMDEEDGLELVLELRR